MEISLFNDEITAFTTDILLFKNYEKIKDLFNKINQDVINRANYNEAYYDQSYIVYNAFKYNLYDNKILKN